MYQASLADMTRQCTANETTITINVMAQGRIVAGPAATGGQVNLPVLVEVLDGDNVVSSQKVSYPVELPATGTQFIFNKADVQIPNAQGGASRFTRIRLGFANGSTRKASARAFPFAAHPPHCPPVHHAPSHHFRPRLCQPF